MKKYFLVAAIAAFFTACNSDVKINEEKLEEAGEKLQKTVEKGADSVGEKLKRLKDKIKDRKKDTIVI